VGITIPCFFFSGQNFLIDYLPAGLNTASLILNTVFALHPKNLYFFTHS
jgi:hypothetical protein